MYEGVVQDLIDELGRLPGVGPKSAQRIAFHVLQAEPTDVRRLAHALLEVKDKVRFCAVCGNVAQQEECGICRDQRRDRSVICVVEEPKDVVAIERTREFRGRYHVLGGAISPIEGVGPDDLRIRELLARLADGSITELILATDPNLEGEATATYLARMVKPMGLRVTRLASGLPVGGDLEYADEVTLGRAFEEATAGCLTVPPALTRALRSARLSSTHRLRPCTREVSSMSDATLNTVTQDPGDFAVQIADQIKTFIVAVTEVSRVKEPEEAVPVLLLQVSQLLLAGGRLGAYEDIVPDERYEPDLGAEPDADGLRERFAALLEPIDVYSEVFDPYEPRKSPVPARISDDLADLVTDLRHGLAHYEEGRTTEGLWWWQFSYFSNWGSTASATLRALQSLIAHIRLNQPLQELDGLDTDQDAGDDDLAEEAGRVMFEEIAGPLGLRPAK